MGRPLIIPTSIKLLPCNPSPSCRRHSVPSLRFSLASPLCSISIPERKRNHCSLFPLSCIPVRPKTAVSTRPARPHPATQRRRPTLLHPLVPDASPSSTSKQSSSSSISRPRQVAVASTPAIVLCFARVLTKRSRRPQLRPRVPSSRRHRRPPPRLPHQGRRLSAPPRGQVLLRLHRQPRPRISDTLSPSFTNASPARPSMLSASPRHSPPRPCLHRHLQRTPTGASQSPCSAFSVFDLRRSGISPS
jgi:hypothetical protein